MFLPKTWLKCSMKQHHIKDLAEGRNTRGEKGKWRQQSQESCRTGESTCGNGSVPCYRNQLPARNPWPQDITKTSSYKDRNFFFSLLFSQIWFAFGSNWPGNTLIHRWFFSRAGMKAFAPKQPQRIWKSRYSQCTFSRQDRSPSDRGKWSCFPPRR